MFALHYLWSALSQQGQQAARVRGGRLHLQVLSFQWAITCTLISQIHYLTHPPNILAVMKTLIILRITPTNYTVYVGIQILDCVLLIIYWKTNTFSVGQGILFHGTRSLITVFFKVFIWILSRSSWIHFTPYSSKFNFNIISSGYNLLISEQRCLCFYHISRVLHYLSITPFLFCHTNNFWPKNANYESSSLRNFLQLSFNF